MKIYILHNFPQNFQTNYTDESNVRLETTIERDKMIISQEFSKLKLLRSLHIATKKVRVPPQKTYNYNLLDAD